VLADFYEQLMVENVNDLAIVFVSSDSDDKSYEDYYSSMPWISVPYAERTIAQALGMVIQYYNHYYFCGCDCFL